jgi:hypothetical protein
MTDPTSEPVSNEETPLTPDEITEVTTRIRQPYRARSTTAADKTADQIRRRY